jgi:putative phosphoribosyl transferase
MRSLYSSTKMFRDRTDAANQLVSELGQFRGTNPLILGIPRGGVPLGRIIANCLEGELDVVLVRKLGAPGYSEVAIGSIAENGKMYLNELARSHADQDYIITEAKREMEKIKRRRAQYTPIRAPISRLGRVVIVVDDGLATGATMMSALQSVKAENPERLVCAVPCASVDGIDLITPYCDEIICLNIDRHFMAVGCYYERFEQVDDDEAIELLEHP